MSSPSVNQNPYSWQNEPTWSKSEKAIARIQARGVTMLRKHVVALCILALCLATVSCQKLDEPITPTGPLTYETAKFADSIPHNYEPLIGVTENSRAPEWIRLWFQRSDGTIAAVFVNVQQGRIYDKALTIPRK